MKSRKPPARRRELGPACEPVLEEEDQGERDQGRAQHRHVDDPVFPDARPEFRRRLRFCKACAGGVSQSGLGRRRRRGQRLQIPFRQGVGDLVEQEILVERADRALHQELERPRRGRVEPGIARHDEESDFGEGLREIRRHLAQVLVVAVAEANAAFALGELDAVEDAAADEARALERIEAIGGDQQRMLAGLQAGEEVFVLGLAQQAAADDGGADQRRIEIDEALFRIIALGPGGGFLLARSREVAGHVAHAEAEPAYGTVADQRHPVVHALLRGVDLAPWLRAGRLLRAEPGEAQRTSHPDRRTADRIVDDQNCNRGAGDDVERTIVGVSFFKELAHVAPDIAGDEALHLSLRDPDQDDRLVVLVQHDAGDRALVIEPDEEVDGLARIAHRAHDIGVQEHVAPKRGSFERPCAGRRALDRTEAIGTGYQVAGLDGGECAAEIDGSAGVVRDAARSSRNSKSDAPAMPIRIARADTLRWAAPGKETAVMAQAS